MSVIRSFLAVVGGGFLAGCYSSVEIAQAKSAGRVPCKPQEMKISEYEQNNLGEFWKATCNGVEYQCAGRAFGTDCAVAKPAVAPTSAP